MTEDRKVLTKGNAQKPTNCVKVSGDSGDKPQRHKNKEKIPKSLRYDLENALVGLCDAWFGEIKPYLIRNNVKVHVHDGNAGGDRGVPEPECSHRDPGSSHQSQRRSVHYADSYSTLQTASKAPCPKLPSQPVSSLKPDQAMENPCPNSKNDLKKSRRKKRQIEPQTQPRLLVPRLCRTYILPENTLVRPIINNNNIGLHLQKPRNKLRNPPPKPKTMNDAPTLTKRKVKEQVERQQVKPQPKEVKKGKSQSPSVKKYPIKDNVLTAESEKVKPRSLSLQFGRCQATTSVFPQKIKTEKPEPATSYQPAEPALFKDDLINIISEKHEKLKKLNKSSVKENASIMNLYSPTCNRVTSKKTFKTPWR